MEKEVWKPIKGYEGKYEVSTFGRVRSVSRKIIYKDGRMRIYKGKILKPETCKNGYLYVNLGREGRAKMVHRLVAETYLDNPDELSDVVHKDNNKKNNSVSNLRWSSHSETQKKSYGLGVNAPGGNMPPKRVMILETGEIFKSIRSCARHINGSPGGIRRCLKDEKDTYKGFHFRLL